MLCSIHHTTSHFSAAGSLCVLHTAPVRPKLEHATFLSNFIRSADSCKLKRVKTFGALRHSRILVGVHYDNYEAHLQD